jgi:hypothetical protein
MMVFKIVREEIIPSLPITALPVTAIKFFEEELCKRGTIPRPTGMPFWFIAEQEILTYRWQSGKTSETETSEIDEEFLWVDVSELLKRLETRNSLFEEMSYLTKFAPLLRKAAPHLSALSLALISTTQISNN